MSKLEGISSLELADRIFKNEPGIDIQDDISTSYDLSSKETNASEDLLSTRKIKKSVLTKTGVVKIGCSTNCRLKCHQKFSVDIRTEIMKNFCKLVGRTQQWDYILNLVKIVDKKQITIANSRRKCSRVYYLNYISNNEEIFERVCLKMFLDTLCISKQTIETALAKAFTKSLDRNIMPETNVKELQEKHMPEVHENIFADCGSPKDEFIPELTLTDNLEFDDSLESQNLKSIISSNIVKDSVIAINQLRATSLAKGVKSDEKVKTRKKGILRKLRNTGMNNIPKNVKDIRIGCTFTCRLKCHEKVSAEQRTAILNSFSMLSNRAVQWDYISNLVKIVDKKTSTVVNKESRRKCSRDYYLKIVLNDREIFERVCLKMFLDTLCISNHTVDTALEKSNTKHADKRGKFEVKPEFLNTDMSEVEDPFADCCSSGDEFIPESSSSDSSESEEYIPELNLSQNLDSSISTSSENYLTSKQDPIYLKFSPIPQKKVRIKKSNPENWKRNIAKKQKNSGNSFINSKGILVNAKEIKRGCTSSCRLKCSEHFSIEVRKSIMKSFYNLNDRARQWDYISNLVKVVNKKYIRILNRESRRKFSRNYYLKYESNDEEIFKRVCLKMFLDTLCITNQTVETAILKSVTNDKDDKRGKYERRINKERVKSRKLVMEYFKTFPAVDYKKNKETHLNADLPISKMYCLYKIWLKEKNSNYDPVTERQYRTIFNDCYNIDYLKPTKDQYDDISISDHNLSDDNLSDIFENEETLPKKISNNLGDSISMSTEICITQKEDHPIHLNKSLKTYKKVKIKKKIEPTTKINIAKMQKKTFINRKGISRRAKEIKRGCTSTCRLKCHKKISTEIRTAIMKSFCNLNRAQQYDYISSLIKIVDKKFITVFNIETRRKWSRNYYLKFLRSDEEIFERVCLKMFMDTLCISKQNINTALEKLNIDEKNEEVGIREPKTLVTKHNNSSPTVNNEESLRIQFSDEILHEFDKCKLEPTVPNKFFVVKSESEPTSSNNIKVVKSITESIISQNLKCEESSPESKLTNNEFSIFTPADIYITPKQDHPMYLKKSATSHKKSKVRKQNPENWKRNIAKKQRNSGYSYVNSKGIPVDAKQIRSGCTTKCRLKCYEKFSVEIRTEIMKNFYNLNDRARQWDYISSLVEIVDKKVTKVLNRESRRKCSRKHYLKLISNNQEILERVCLKMFLDTLCITKQNIETALEKSVAKDREDRRGKYKRKINELREKSKNMVITHIQTFPVVHLSETTGEDLNADLTVAKMYRLYKLWIEENNGSYKPVTERQYRDIFNNCYKVNFLNTEADQHNTSACSDLLASTVSESLKCDTLKPETCESENTTCCDSSGSTLSDNFKYAMPKPEILDQSDKPTCSVSVVSTQSNSFESVFLKPETDLLDEYTRCASPASILSDNFECEAELSDYLEFDKLCEAVSTDSLNLDGNNSLLAPISSNKLNCDKIGSETEPTLSNNLVSLFNNSENCFITPKQDNPLYLKVTANSHKKVKIRKRNPENWKHNIAKRNRNSGHSYINRKGISIDAKKIRSGCGSSCRLKCHNKFSVNIRTEIMKSFYDLNDRARQWDYISSHVKVVDKKITTVGNKESRRKWSRNYYLKFVTEDKEILERVCLKMFLDTLCISKQNIETALEKLFNRDADDRRGKYKRKINELRERSKNMVITHIQSFPAVHLSETTGEDLNADLSVAKMYRQYKIWIEENKSGESVTERQYRDIFNNYFGYLKPKNDP